MNSKSNRFNYFCAGFENNRYLHPSVKEVRPRHGSEGAKLYKDEREQSVSVEKFTDKCSG